MPMMPMMPITSSGMPNSISVNSAPSPAEGRVEMIVIGWIALSYSMPRMIVDRDQCGEDQDRRAAQRILKRLRAALKARRNRSRQVQLFRGLLDRRYRRAHCASTHSPPIQFKALPGRAGSWVPSSSFNFCGIVSPLS
jgi:hypothetical protein